MDPGKRYPSDLSDPEWALVEPLLPPPKPPGTRGHPQVHSRREVLNAILYHVKCGGPWRYLPRDFPPWPTVYDYFDQWRRDGTLDRLLDTLRTKIRQREGRVGEPSAGIIDAQAVKGAPTVGARTRGYDTAKATNGRKRHIATDTLGLLLVVLVTAASVQDRVAARALCRRLRRRHKRIRLLWADAGYTGTLIVWASTILRITIEIVTKLPGQVGFQVLPRRWVVERSLAWIVSWRRNARDYERDPAVAEAMVKWAMVGIMLRRLGRASPT